MTNNETIRYCARLETGFRTSSAHLKELERDFSVTLQRAREFGTEHGPPDDWKTHWDQQWNNVEGILGRISVLVNAMDVSVESSDSDRLEKALEAWDSLQSEGANLVEALDAIRAQAIGLNAAVRKDWNLLAHTIECHLETVQACARALRIKLELLRKQPKQQVDHLVQDFLAKLPRRPPADEMSAEIYQQEYRKAVIALEQEQHAFLGFMDVVKGLLIWVETADERTRKNLSLQVDAA